MAKYGMYPQPVYHATLDDGRAVRMTVWQKADAPAKGFDWEACRRTILTLEDSTAPLRRWCDGHNADDVRWTALERPLLRETGRRIIAAHLEQSGVVLADDPLTEAKPVKRRINNAAIVAALKAYMNGQPDARQIAEMALAA